MGERTLQKLALWHTKTFRPILTHDDLEPLMAVLGFVALPAIEGIRLSWKEYAFHVSRPRSEDDDELLLRPARVREQTEPRHPLRRPVRPRLPFPRIDGLHVVTYNAFVDAVGFHIGVAKVADHFHVRGMAVHREHDRVFDKVFRRMKDDRRGGDDQKVVVYREGTIDRTAVNVNFGGGGKSAGGSSAAAPPMCMVSLKEIFSPTNHIAV
ncbi:tubulin-tyrosine ligase [Wolffia australiana]